MAEPSLISDPIKLAIALVQDFEGLELEPYYDPRGFPTIGYGRLLSRDKKRPLSDWDTITLEKAEEYLAQDLQVANYGVKRLVKRGLNVNQHAALIDFVFNCGYGNLRTSTLLMCVNRGDFNACPPQFMRWIFSGGVVFNGLIRRRKAEAVLFGLPSPI